MVHKQEEHITDRQRPAFGGYLSGTEGIRGIFCLLVVVYHTYLFSAPAGAPSRGTPYLYVISRFQLALPVFFVLSAFLLYRPFVQSVLRGKRRPTFGAYLTNRVLRIFPAYWTILTAAAIAGVTIVWIPKHDIGFHLPTFLADAFLVQGLHPSGVQTGVAPAWSLAVEWVFYLLLPLMVMLALRIGGSGATLWGRRAALLVPAGLLYVVGIAGRELAKATNTAADPSGVLNTWHAVIDKSFLPWADLFAIGMLIAVLRVEHEAGRVQLPRWLRPAVLAAALVIGCSLVWLQAHGQIEFHHYNAVMAWAIGLCFAAVVLWKVDNSRDPLMRLLTWRPLVASGNMSLSLYLLHYPLIAFIIGKGVFKNGWGGMLFNAAVVLAIVLPLAYLSHRYIELPFMNRKRDTTTEGPPSLEELSGTGTPAPEPEPARS